MEIITVCYTIKGIEGFSLLQMGVSAMQIRLKTSTFSFKY